MGRLLLSMFAVIALTNSAAAQFGAHTLSADVSSQRWRFGPQSSTGYEVHLGMSPNGWPEWEVGLMTAQLANLVRQEYAPLIGAKRDSGPGISSTVNTPHLFAQAWTLQLARRWTRAGSLHPLSILDIGQVKSNYEYYRTTLTFPGPCAFLCIPDKVEFNAIRVGEDVVWYGRVGGGVEAGSGSWRVSAIAGLSMGGTPDTPGLGAHPYRSLFARIGVRAQAGTPWSTK